MFFRAKKKMYRSERSFSVMLAEELLRAELRRIYGPDIKILQCEITGSLPARKQSVDDDTITRVEENALAPFLYPVAGRMVAFDRVWERELDLQGLIGPFDRLYPNNPPEDRRRHARKVYGCCRLFSVETNVVMWRPHYLLFGVDDAKGQKIVDERMFYEDGRLLNQPHFRSTENPCQDMCDVVIPAQMPHSKSVS